ncbi:MAG: hypothetical protein ACOYI1_10710, partial [Caldicoprobacteraceae bacterium]
RNFGLRLATKLFSLSFSILFCLKSFFSKFLANRLFERKISNKKGFANYCKPLIFGGERGIRTLGTPF